MDNKSTCRIGTRISSLPLVIGFAALAHLDLVAQSSAQEAQKPIQRPEMLTAGVFELDGADETLRGRIISPANLDNSQHNPTFPKWPAF